MIESGPESPPTLHLGEVGYRYGRRVALDSVSCTFDSRSIALLGPNGAGKSTLIRLLTTEVPLQSGSFAVRGHWLDQPESLRSFRRRIGVLPQDLRINGGITCEAFLHYVAWLREVPRAAAQQMVTAALDSVGLLDRAEVKVRTLSGGMRQRLGLAQAVVSDPALLVLDEPTVGLDPRQRAECRELMRGFGVDRTLLFSTHLVDDVAAVADEVLILERGRVVFAGPLGVMCGGTPQDRPDGTDLERAYLRLVRD